MYINYEWNIWQFYDFKGVFSGSLSPNGVPSSKAAVSNEDTKVHVDYVNNLKHGS